MPEAAPLGEHASQTHPRPAHAGVREFHEPDGVLPDAIASLGRLGPARRVPALLSLQRSAGNTAVDQALRRAAGRHAGDGVIQRFPDAEIRASMDAQPPIYMGPLVTLNGLSMHDLLATLQLLGAARMATLKAKLGDKFKTSPHVVAGYATLELKARGLVDPEQVDTEIDSIVKKGSLSPFEQFDVVSFIGGDRLKNRQRLLDGFRDDIYARIGRLGNPVFKDDADSILRRIDVYMRLLEQELPSERKKRAEEVQRFEFFKAARAVDAKSAEGAAEKDPAKLKQLKAEKAALDLKLKELAAGQRKPVGTSGRLADGRLYVAYENYVKVIDPSKGVGGGTWAWLNNNPGNMIASPLALGAEFHNKLAGDFAVFPAMDLGYAGIVIQLKIYLSEQPAITIVGACGKWANRKSDNPKNYATAVVDELSTSGKHKKPLTIESPLSELSDAELLNMAYAMAGRVERVDPGVVYTRSQVAEQPWLGPLLGVMPPPSSSSLDLIDLRDRPTIIAPP